MSTPADPQPDGRDWRFLRVALAVVTLFIVADVVIWKVHDMRNPPATRLASTVSCLEQHGVIAVVPAGDPLSATAGDGSLRTTIEGNGVIVALAASEEQAIRIAAGYTSVGGDLTGKLERRGRTVYVWEGPSSPTQRQALYDCQY